MKLIVTIVILSLIFTACREDKYIPEYLRKAIFYYKNQGDTLCVLKNNNNDTLTFVINEVNRTYFIPYLWGHSHCEQFYSTISSTNNSYGIDIEVDCEPICYIHIIKNYKEIFSFSRCSRYYIHKNIDGKNYFNVYLLTSLHTKDSIFTSPEKGIIKVWNDSITLSLIEQ
jgi:hypothetical protein